MTTPTPRLLPLASDGCGCCAPSAPPAATSDPAMTIADATPNPLATYQVEGLACGHRAGRVTEAIRVLPFVDDAQVDLAVGGVSTVTVTGAPSPEEVRQAIEEAGYIVLVS